MVQMKEDFFDTKFPMARLSGKSRVLKLLGFTFSINPIHVVFHHVHGLNIVYKKLLWVFPMMLTKLTI